METDNAQSEGRTREMVDEDKEIDEVRLSTEDGVSTDFEKVSTDFEKVSTDKPKVSTDGSKVSTDEQIEGADDQVEGSEEIFESTEEQRPGTEEKVESTAGQIEGTEDQSKEEIATPASQTSTQTPTSIIFGDDETIATLLINMSQAKAASKEKEKGVENSNKLESDEKLARKVQEEWEAEEERNRLAKEEATNEALIKNFYDIKARIEEDIILAEKLQEQEREQFTIEERAKFPSWIYLLAQRMSLAQQRVMRQSETDLHQESNIQAMYEKIKRSDEDFIAIGSVEDESLIKKMKKKDSSKGEEIKQESKEEVKEAG
ncbi:hypothetical protein Tco_1506924 [Tanacetum coccineum]